MEEITALSLFDGMSCGQIALNRCGIKYKTYYASEIDKPAIKITQKNYPNTIQLGDVRYINIDDLPKIDLLLGGSPCQSFSFAGKRKGMTTTTEIEVRTLEHYLELKEQNFEFEGQSYLFWEYIRIRDGLRKKNPQLKYLLENVMMGSKWQRILTQAVGINPICINSSLVSAQNRERLYWTNIYSQADGLFGDAVCKIPQPKDNCITWSAIREFNVHNKYYYTKKGLEWIRRHGIRKNKTLNIWGPNDKCQMIEASHHKKYSSQRYFGIHDSDGLRYITPNECERAQTVPDSYTEGVSDTQRYRMLGNGWTIDVVAHILSYYNL